MTSFHKWSKATEAWEKWIKLKLTVNFEAFKEQIKKASNAFISIKWLFKSTSKAQHRKVELPLPPSKCVLANIFSDYFDSKISKIIIKLVTTEIGHTMKHGCTKKNLQFEIITEETKKLFQNAPNILWSTSLPTWLLRENIDIFLPM